MSLSKTESIERYPLEPSAAEMKQWIQAVSDQIIPFVESLPDQPVTNQLKIEPLLHKLKETLPKEGKDLNELLKFVFQELLPVGINLPSAGYLAYIPVGGLFHTAIAEFITTAINR